MTSAPCTDLHTLWSVTLIIASAFANICPSNSFVKRSPLCLAVSTFLMEMRPSPSRGSSLIISLIRPTEILWVRGRCRMEGE